MNTLGDRLKYLRSSRHLTQEKLAKELHLTRNQISTYENNTVEPSIEVIKSYCNYFEVNADFILDIHKQSSELKLIDKLMTQIQSNLNKMSPKQREIYLKQIYLYAIFLHRYKEYL